MTSRRLRIAIDARVRSGEAGGVESVIIGLASGLTSLDDGPEEYRFLTIQGGDDWLRPHVGGDEAILAVPPSGGLRRRLRQRAPGLAKAWGKAPERLRPPVSGPPASDGTVERADVDVMHFAFQAGFLTAIPSIYHPHDLQHVHLPEFFEPRTRRWRELWYGTLCRQASMVAVASSWTKRDVEGHFNLEPDKVRVVPWAPPTAAYRHVSPERAAALRAQLGVPTRYMFYPAQTWPHKNHVNLLRAMARLRDDGVDVALVASGLQTEHFASIRAEQSRLGLEAVVQWPGFVSADELVALFAGATAVIVPSRFEAASAPLWEAFQAGVPAACSTVTSLPDQAGDAALLFDPDDVPGMADAIRRLWTDPILRSQLVGNGRLRLTNRSWDRVARSFRAHYRRLAGSTLTDEDHALLTEAADV
jgi:glycosyltransferase involved in cell wall biosynthesis